MGFGWVCVCCGGRKTSAILHRPCSRHRHRGLRVGGCVGHILSWRQVRREAGFSFKPLYISCHIYLFQVGYADAKILDLLLVVKTPGFGARLWLIRMESRRLRENAVDESCSGTRSCHEHCTDDVEGCCGAPHTHPTVDTLHDCTVPEEWLAALRNEMAPLDLLCRLRGGAPDFPMDTDKDSSKGASCEGCLCWTTH